MSFLLTRILVPMASTDDADTTCAALEPYLDDLDSIRLVNVIEKASGALDKSSVEQRRVDAAELFELAQDRLLTGDVVLDLITSSDRPVIVLPEVEDGGETGG